MTQEKAKRIQRNFERIRITLLILLVLLIIWGMMSAQ